MRHVRQALRRLTSSPGFTAVAVFTLAVGIAANAAVFSVVHGVLIAPLPYPEPERLVDVSHTAPGLELDDINQSRKLHLFYRDEASAFESLGLYDDVTVALTGTDAPERLQAGVVTPSIFTALRARPARGRLFRDEEGAPGAPATAVLADGLWRRTFGADPGVVGRTVVLDGEPTEIVGVMPPGFDFLRPDVDVWLPMVLDPEREQLGAFGTGSLGRLKDGVGLEAAEADLARLVARLPELEPGDGAAQALSRAGFAAHVIPYRDEVVGDVGDVLWVLLGTVGFVLLIACANVANLFLARAEGRQREIAIRTALGAGRGDLVTATLVESVALALFAGLLGLGLAAAGVRLLLRLGPQELPRLQEVGLSAPVIAFTAVVALVAGLLFGLVPALRTRVRRLSSVLKEGGRSASAGHERHLARRLLVAAQVALALVLLVCAGLMVRSFDRLSKVDPGFEPRGALTFELALPEGKYPDDVTVHRFYGRLVERLEALPGVTSAAVDSTLPLSGFGSGSGHSFEGEPVAEDSLPAVLRVERMTPGYVEAMGLRLLEGRDLEPAEVESRSGAVLVNRAAAERHWPGESPVGRRLMPGRSDDRIDDPWYHVVGVVADVRAETLTDEPPPTVYYPMLAKVADDWIVRRAGVVVRAAGDPRTLAGPIRDAVWSLDPDLPVANVTTAGRMVERARARPAFTLTMLAIAAAVALVLGSVGTYGVVAYLVGQRRSELGLRMALGARAGDVVAMVLKEGLVIVVVGAIFGLALAAAVTRWFEALLFQVDPLDPLTFAAVPLVLLAVALLACFVPAWRAAHIDPAVSLRHE